MSDCNTGLLPLRTPASDAIIWRQAYTTTVAAPAPAGFAKHSLRATSTDTATYNAANVAGARLYRDSPELHEPYYRTGPVSILL